MLIICVVAIVADDYGLRGCDVKRELGPLCRVLTTIGTGSFRSAILYMKERDLPDLGCGDCRLLTRGSVYRCTGIWIDGTEGRGGNKQCNQSQSQSGHPP